jgi:hypothetical protein
MKHTFTENGVLNDELAIASSRIWGRQVYNRSDSEECLQLASKWYMACKAHDSCHRRYDAVLPTRVIDVSNYGYARGRYAALSYCWGDVLPLRLTKDVFEQFEKSMPISHLPKTFRDAIEATRSLGLRYLWIDALCIIQH